MQKGYRLYVIMRELDLLCYRADRLKPGPRRDALVRLIEALNVELT